MKKSPHSVLMESLALGVIQAVCVSEILKIWDQELMARYWLLKILFFIFGIYVTFNFLGFRIVKNLNLYFLVCQH